MHWKLNSRWSLDAKSRNINILIYTPVCVSCNVRTWCQYFPYNSTENSEDTMVIIVFGDSCTTVAQPRPGQNLQSFFTSLLGRPRACEACNYTWSYLIILNHTDGITPLHMDSKNHKFYRPPLCRIVLRVCFVKFYQPVWTIHGIVGPSYKTQKGITFTSIISIRNIVFIFPKLISAILFQLQSSSESLLVLNRSKKSSAWNTSLTSGPMVVAGWSNDRKDVDGGCFYLEADRLICCWYGMYHTTQAYIEG